MHTVRFPSTVRAGGGSLLAPHCPQPGPVPEVIERTKEIAKEITKENTKESRPRSHYSSANAMTEGIGRESGCSSPPGTKLICLRPPLQFPLPEFPL